MTQKNRHSFRSQAKLMTALVLLSLQLSSVLSCSEAQEHIASAVNPEDSVSMMTTYGVNTLISDSGVIKYRIVTERWDVNTVRQPSRWEFMKGIFFEQFDEQFHVQAYIQADTAWYFDKMRLWKLRGRVSIRNVKGLIYTSEELYWDGMKHEFYSTVFYNMSKRGSAYINTYVGGTSGISETNIRYTCTGYYMRKYASDNSNRNTNQDGFMRLIRLADVYMNFAEVAYQVAGPYQTVSGVNMSAADAVNAIRDRAGMPNLPAGLSTADFEKRYRNERRIEFALEQDRFFSLRRWKALDAAKQVTGMRITQNGSNYTYQRFAFEPRQTAAENYLLYPINTGELNKITKLTGQNWQNPGW